MEKTETHDKEWTTPVKKESDVPTLTEEVALKPERNPLDSDFKLVGYRDATGTVRTEINEEIAPSVQTSARTEADVHVMSYPIRRRVVWSPLRPEEN